MRIWTLLLALALLVAACGGDGATTATATTPPAEDEAPTEPAEEEAPTEPAAEDTEPADGAAAAGDVAVADSALGPILVDADGFTLYAFLNDSGGQSSCTDQCAETWPPLVVEGEPTAGEGADAGLLSLFTREDGSQQVVYGDWPLYRYAPDTAPGDTTGQGVGDVWFVVSPDGEPVQDAAASSGAQDGGYGG